MQLVSLKSNKKLLVLNIIVFVLLIAAVSWNSIMLLDAIDDENVAIGMIVMAIVNIYVYAVYIFCFVTVIVTLCKKYFNWLSYTNLALSIVLLLLVISPWIIANVLGAK